MTLQELRFIVALAREKHFKNASTVCHVSQPTLSIAIQKLEKKLGVILFERYKNDVRITPIGNQIVERAKRILDETDAIKQAAKASHDQLSGVFKLGVIFTIGPYLLPSLITELNQLAPNMPIQIHEDYTANLRKKLATGELDAIIISLPFKESSIVTRVLYKEPFVVLMPGDHVLTKKKIVHENELSQFNLLMLGEGHCFRDQILSSCPMCFTAKESEKRWHTVEGSSLETIRHMVASKMGLTILPMTAAMTHTYREKILTSRPLRANSPNRSVALAWRQSFSRFKAIETILKATEKCKLPNMANK
jgi:LysR family hydrogen peroxide-inducible transcriptional activator